MGIPRVRAEKASAANFGKGAAAAIDWVFAHGDDPDIDTPLPKATAPPTSGASGGSPAAPPEDLISNVMDMGFSRPQAIKALKSTNNSVERAVDWLFSHPDDAGDDMDVEPSSESAAAKPAPKLDTAPARTLICLLL